MSVNVDNKQLKGEMSLAKPKPDPSTEIIEVFMGKKTLKYEAHNEKTMRKITTGEFNQNGLSPVSKKLEARTPPANPPPGLNFERPKLSHIIKASHV